jgi:hypothetical protein
VRTLRASLESWAKRANQRDEETLCPNDPNRLVSPTLPNEFLDH